jgi:hypothetical protein
MEEGKGERKWAREEVKLDGAKRKEMGGGE